MTGKRMQRTLELYCKKCHDIRKGIRGFFDDVSL